MLSIQIYGIDRQIFMTKLGGNIATITNDTIQIRWNSTPFHFKKTLEKIFEETFLVEVWKNQQYVGFFRT